MSLAVGTQWEEGPGEGGLTSVFRLLINHSEDTCLQLLVSLKSRVPFRPES